MPIYEYACPKCGEFEVTQRITEDALKKCPTCKSKVRKLISSTSFQLKGSGWYVTDYAKKGAKETTKDGGDSAGGDGAAKSTDGESKSKDKPSETKSKDKASETKSEPTKTSKTAEKAA
jgi:putative FmdB family regulatory protein